MLLGSLHGAGAGAHPAPPSLQHGQRFLQGGVKRLSASPGSSIHPALGVAANGLCLVPPLVISACMMGN